MSRVRRLTAAAALVALAVGVAPAAAQDGEAPLIVDPCGDADSQVTVRSDTVTLEEGLGHVDLRAGHLGLLFDDGDQVAGLVATLEVCGEASADQGGYSLEWGFEDGCKQSLTWTLRVQDDLWHFYGQPGTDPDVSTESRVIYMERCRDGNHLETVFRLALPDDAIAFVGPTVAFTLTLDLVPDEALARFAFGTVWRTLFAMAMDQDASTLAGGGGDIPEWEASVRVDRAWGVRNFVVEPPPDDD